MLIETLLCGACTGGWMHLKAQVKMSVLHFRMIVLVILWTTVEEKASEACVHLASFILLFLERYKESPGYYARSVASSSLFLQKSWSYCYPNTVLPFPPAPHEVIPFPDSNIQKGAAHCLCCNFDDLTGRTVIQILASECSKINLAYPHK